MDSAPTNRALIGPPIRLVRIIARLNIGGPSIQAITLTQRLRGLGYTTTLVRGLEGKLEGTMDHLAAEWGVEPVLVRTMRRNPGWNDLRALVSLIRIIRRQRPQLVHTHAAKAGTIGRVAALTSRYRGEPPVLVHTFHGHSLSGYFAPRTAAIYRFIEKMLARRTDRLIAVSDEVRDDLVALGVAPPEQFEVIPLGFDLSRFCVGPEARRSVRQTLRRQLGIPATAVVVTLLARLVPIKRVDRFLRAAVELWDVVDLHFLIVGDGELNDSLRRSPAAQELGDRVTWTGFRRDVPAVCFASDIMVLSSDNEGTPVSLIEAAAAGLPVISTRVGGAAKVVLDGKSGLLVECDEGRGLAAAVRALATDRAQRERMGSAGKAHVLETFSLDRLVLDLDGLYRRLLDPQRKSRVAG